MAAIAVSCLCELGVDRACIANLPILCVKSNGFAYGRQYVWAHMFERAFDILVPEAGHKGEVTAGIYLRSTVTSSVPSYQSYQKSL
jgi:hypothetical protein